MNVQGKIFIERQVGYQMASLGEGVTGEDVQDLMTLEAARVNCGYNLNEAAGLFGIHRDTLWKYEQDSTRVPRTFMIQATQVYKLPQSKIFFGVKSEFFRIKRDAEFTSMGSG